LLKALLDSAIPYYTYLYARGPNLGQDFPNPFGRSFPWPHSDIAYATRASTTQPFSGWSLTERRGTYFIEEHLKGSKIHKVMAALIISFIQKAALGILLLC
jgi:hypothetical protein